MADLAKLVVKLEAESAKLHRDLDRANKKLGKFERASRSASKALRGLATIGGVALGTLGVAMAAMTVKTLNLADRIGKLSQTTGLSTETLSRLRFQADLTGTSFEAMTKGVGKLQRSMFDANRGLKEQADAFESLGVAVADPVGNLRDTETVMIEVAEQFKNMADGATKAATAQILFGKAGMQMIPFLNEGAEGIKAMADEADALGITMDSKLTSAAERTNDNLTRMKTALEGVFLRVMAQVMPHIEAFTIALVEWAKNSKNVEKAMSAIGGALKSLATVAVFLKGVFNLLGEGIGAMAAAVSFVLQGEFSKAMDVWKEGTVNSLDTVMKTVEDMGDIWTDVPKKIAADSETTGKQIAAPMIVAEKQIGLSVDSVKAQLKTFDKEMQTAIKKSADISKEFQDRFNNVTSSSTPIGKANTIDVGLLELQAQQSLKAGDIDGATVKIRTAFDILDAMKDSGSQSSMVLEGLAANLKRVGDQIADENLANVQAQIDFDMSAMMQQVGVVNDAMQAVLDANPLTQSISINGELVPNSATQKAAGSSAMKQINLTMPSGNVATIIGDQSDVDFWKQELALEATKRGTR